MTINVYDYGDDVRVTGTFTDADGTAQDPTAVLFSYKVGTGTATTYTYGEDEELVKSATGVYYVDIDASTADTEIWCRFYSTGTGKASEEHVFQVGESEFD